MRELRGERGLLSKIAIGIGVKPQAVHQWDVVPLERVLEVERVTGKPRHELRPDFFHARSSLPEMSTPAFEGSKSEYQPAQSVNKPGSESQAELEIGQQGHRGKGEFQ